MKKIGWVLVLSWLAIPALAQTYATNGDARLAATIDEALDRNPRVRESLARYRAALQRIPQVSALPDPMLEVKQFVRTPDPQTTMLSFSQHFPWWGKRSDQGKVAAKEADFMQQMHEAEKAEIVRQVKLAYYYLGYLDRAVQITEEDQALLEHYETLAQARYAQGMGLQQEVVKLQAEITRDRNRFQELRRLRVDAEAILNRLLDQPAETPVSVVLLGTRPAVVLGGEDLSAVSRARRPEIHAALLQIEKDEKKVQLARRQYWPDVTLSFGMSNVKGRQDLAGGGLNSMPGEGKNMYSFSVGLNLPLSRRKYDAGVLEATEDFLANREAYRDEVNQAETTIRSVEFQVRTIQEQLSLFESTLLPQAEQSLRSAEAAYTTGQLGVLDLLDSERVLLDVRLGLAQLHSEYMRSLAEMERAIGAPFPEVRP